MEEMRVAANGVPVYYHRQPNTHSIFISLYVKSGVLYERENAGITHFLEHLHFRKLGGRLQKELYYALESIGANFGGRTYKEFLQFYLTANPKYFRELARIASDLLGPLEADAKDFSLEKKIILSEIREDNQQNDIDFLSDRLIWEGTNLASPVLGTMASVRGLTLPLLQAEKEKIFARDNLFFYVTGCFEEEHIAALLREIERHDLSGRPGPGYDNRAQVPAGFRQRAAAARIHHRRFPMHDVRISFDVDFSRLRRHEMLYLDSLLSEGLCSLLRAELIEKKGLLYSFYSTLEQYSNIGVYSFTFSVHKGKLQETVQSFISVLREAKRGLSESDMKTVRVFKTDNQMQLLDDPENLNWTFAYENHILRNHYGELSEIAEEYRQIRKERLVEIANEIFRPEHAMLVSMGNKKGLSEARLRDILTDL